MPIKWRIKLVEYTDNIYHQSITYQIYWSARCASHGHNVFRLVIPYPSYHYIVTQTLHVPYSSYHYIVTQALHVRTTVCLLLHVSRTHHVTKCSTWSLAIIRQHRPRVTENKVLRKILDRTVFWGQ